MSKDRDLTVSADAAKKIAASREADERAFLARTFDYLRENAVFGDVHEYGCDRRPLLPLAIETGKAIPVPTMKYFGFASETPPRVVPGRMPKGETEFDAFVSKADLEKKTGGQATLLTGPAATLLGRAERDRFMNNEHKIALAIIHAPAGADAKAALEFAEPLLTEGSIVYFADLLSGYRRTGAKDAGRVFMEFQKDSRYQYLRFADIGWWGRAYMACLPVDLPFEKL